MALFPILLARVQREFWIGPVSNHFTMLNSYLFLSIFYKIFFFSVVFICHDSILFHFSLGHCLTPKKEGPCRGSFPRWHYNAASSKCEQFFFGGCKENSNNYLSEQECLNACKNTKGNANLIVLWQCCNIGLKEHYRNKGNKSLFMCVFQTSMLLFFLPWNT